MEHAHFLRTARRQYFIIGLVPAAIVEFDLSRRGFDGRAREPKFPHVTLSTYFS